MCSDGYRRLLEAAPRSDLWAAASCDCHLQCAVSTFLRETGGGCLLCFCMQRWALDLCLAPNRGHSHPLSMRPSCHRNGKRPLAVWLALSCSPPVQGGIPENGSLFSADRGQFAKQSTFDGLLVSVTRELAVNHHHPPLPCPRAKLAFSTEVA